MKTKFLLMITALILTACGQNAPTANNQMTKPATNQTATPTATATATVAPVNSNTANASPPISPVNTSDKSKIKNFDGKGVVTKINLEIGSVALDHEEIKGLMPAMEGMEFYVSDKKMLDNLKIGDKVDFVLEDNAGAEQIVKIVKK